MGFSTARRTNASLLGLALLAVGCGARSALLLGDDELASGGSASSSAGSSSTSGAVSAAAGAFSSSGGSSANAGSPGSAAAGGRPPAAGCEIDGMRYDSGAANPDNGCQLCEPRVSTTSWAASGSASCVSAVSVGSQHACAIVGLSAQCWGKNDFGQLGNGSSVGYRAAPVEVAGLGETVIAISAGAGHSCAILKRWGNTTAGQAGFCWGGNNLGQLGNGSTTSSALPVAVRGLSANVTAISAGLGFSCAVVSGAVLCWGANPSGELGNGSTTSSNVPVAVRGLERDVSALSAGSEHACAVQRGVAYCWGKNAEGELGDGTTKDSAVPVRVSGLMPAAQIVAGQVGTCAIVDGADWCWGSNMYGQVGSEDGTIRTQPVPVVSLSSRVTSVAVGGQASCALRDGTAFCWGDVTTAVQNGNILIGSILLPTHFGPAGAGLTAISENGENGCLIQGGRVSCWGFNEYGQLGNNSQIASANPVLVQFP